MGASLKANLAVSVTPPSALVQGYNSVNGAGKSTCITASNVSKTDSQAISTINVTTNATDTANSIRLSGSASVAYLGNSANAKSSYFSSLKLTSYAVTVVVYSNYSTIQSATKYSISPDIPTVMDDAQALAFFELYGDSFLTNVTFGAEYIASYVFYCDSVASQQQIEASLSASSFNGAITANAQAEIDKITSTTSVQWELYQYIGGVVGVTAPSAENIVSFALSFPAVAEAASPDSILSYTTTGYESFLSGSFDKIAANRNYLVGTEFIDGLTESWSDIEDALDVMNQLLLIYDYYGKYVDPMLNSYYKVATEDSNSIIAQMQDYDQNPLQAFPVLQLPALQNGTPTLAYEPYVYNFRFKDDPLHNVFGWNDINIDYADLDPQRAILNRTSITSITVLGNKDVNLISTSYYNFSQQSGATYEHGWSGDWAKGTLLLNAAPDSTSPAFLSALVNRSNDKTIRYLWLQNAQGESIQIGGSGNSDFENSHTFPDGQFAVGFAGACVDYPYMTNLVLICFSLKPATWTPLA